MYDVLANVSIAANSGVDSVNNSSDNLNTV